jgi:ribosomal protein S12 methylthiotransferase
MNPKAYHLVSLGCAKNTVDSESMSQLLNHEGFHPTDQPSRAGVLIVNTCGFIGPAKEESLQVLKDLAKKKRKGQLLIAAGCLTQRYGMDVARQVPGVDGILGTQRWMDVVEVVQRTRQGKSPQPQYHLPETAQTSPSTQPGEPAAPIELPAKETGVLRLAVLGASAYIKIADGCRRPCAFCAIPLIKGTAISRPMQAILHEAQVLQEAGIRELILIAQDTTDYGYDLERSPAGARQDLPLLLQRLAAQAPGIDWMRILYLYPGFVPEPLLEVMASNPQILPYLDMPLQHAHPETLRRMQRPANIDWTYRTIEKMRLALPDLALRTTFIVGYPGETEAEFQALLDFVKELRFDRVGVFQYSFEPGTPSEPLGDPIPAAVKQERYERLMELQQGISLERNQSQVGRTLPVLIEGTGDGVSLGRSYRDAPEIDGMVIVEGELPVGEIIPISITGALTYDLSGVPARTAPLQLIPPASEAASPLRSKKHRTRPHD